MARPEGGAYTALPIWAEFFKLAQAGVPNANLIRPQDLKTCTSSEGATDLCLIGGSSIRAASDNDNNTQTQTEIDTSNISDDSIF